jgi:hypothetical protein
MNQGGVRTDPVHERIASLTTSTEDPNEMVAKMRKTTHMVKRGERPWTTSPVSELIVDMVLNDYNGWTFRVFMCDHSSCMDCLLSLARDDRDSNE